jgi:uncharacterized caspase-like protein
VAPDAAVTAGRRAALLVSSSVFDAEPTLSALPGVKHDAAEFAQVLADPRIGAFEVAEAVDRPSHEAARDIQKFLVGAKRADTVLVYLTGHGVLDKRGRLYFAAVNTESKLLESTAIEARWMFELLEDCKAQTKIVILDCCYSGAAGGVGMGADVDQLAQFAQQGRGFVLLTSSRSSQQSFQIETELRLISVFTAGLVDGLRAGTADRDGDGVISVEDAFRHAVVFVQDHGSLQNPQISLQRGEGEIVLAFAARQGMEVPEPGLRLVHTLRGDDGWMYDVAFSPDGALLATASGSGVIRLWDTETGECRHKLPIERAATGPWHVEIAEDGRRLTADGGDGTRVAFDMRTLKTIYRAERYGDPLRADADRSRRESWSATLDDEGVVYLWYAFELVTTFEAHEGGTSAVAFHPTRPLLATAGGDQVARIWELPRR